MFKFSGNAIPTKISPCPIKDAIAEIRFADSIPIEFLSGLIYNELKNSGKFQLNDLPKRLPINDIPQYVKIQDINLKYQPHYVIEANDNTEIRIGLNSIAVAVVSEYIGWNRYFENIKNVFNLINALNLIKNIERIGLRYSSFFDTKLFENINLKLQVAKHDFKTTNTYIRSEWQYDNDSICVLQLTNNAIFNEQGKPPVSGSLLDIDISSNSKTCSIEVVSEEFNKYHVIEKEIFFNLLTSDFIATLNPEYKYD
ncbi:MAG: hypothetical protein QG673_1118 [Pseudomonadota bacterium]|nr:hypothetical protein [Pseudomonadota bacterium]